MKERPVVERLKNEPPIDAVHHFLGLLAGGIEAEVHQDHETVERNKQSAVFVWPAPVAGSRLPREKFRSPTCGCDASALSCNRIRRFIGKIPHDLPSNGRIGIEEPFEALGPRYVVVC